MVETLEHGLRPIIFEKSKFCQNKNLLTFFIFTLLCGTSKGFMKVFTVKSS